MAATVWRPRWMVTGTLLTVMVTFGPGWGFAPGWPWLVISAVVFMTPHFVAEPGDVSRTSARRFCRHHRLRAPLNWVVAFFLGWVAMTFASPSGTLGP